MMEPVEENQAEPQTCQSIDWYTEGDVRTVEFGDLKVTVRFVGRKGRRARIAILGPPSITFTWVERV